MGYYIYIYICTRRYPINDSESIIFAILTNAFSLGSGNISFLDFQFNRKVLLKKKIYIYIAVYRRIHYLIQCIISINKYSSY